MQGIIRGIISNESVCQKLQHEIATIVEEQGVSTSECVSEVILKAMPYLQACISEGIRVYPAITQLRERVVPPEGDSLHGYHVPGGTFVAFNGLTSQFDPIHGDNLDAYRPERWLIEDKIHLAHMQRNLDLNFGYGTSKCLGINIASTEMSKVIFEVSDTVTNLVAYIPT
jgi:cytochrome P450